MTEIEKIYYWDLTFPEVREVAKEKRVILIPVGSVEQHGHHLPIKMDCVPPIEICRMAAERARYQALVAPPVFYGFEGFVTNFPGTINITEQNYIGYVTDIMLSLAGDGFSRIILINGHGGNPPYLNLAMRRLNQATYPNTVACVISWWDLITEELEQWGESEWGGMGHACEMETSVILHTDPGLVKMDQAYKELWNGDVRKNVASQGNSTALGGRSPGSASGGTPLGPAAYVGRMGGMGGNKYGIMGDPTVATAEKGRRWLEAAADHLADFIVKWKNFEVLPVADHH